MKSVYTFLLALLMNITGVAFAFAPTLKTTVTTTSLFMSDGEKQTGTVKWFNTMKGYGFIVPDGDGPDLFVHQTEIQASGFRSLADGESVEFTPVEDGNGRIKATAVTGPGGADVQGAPFRENDNYDSY